MDEALEIFYVPTIVSKPITEATKAHGFKNKLIYLYFLSVSAIEHLNIVATVCCDINIT